MSNLFIRFSRSKMNDGVNIFHNIWFYNENYVINNLNYK